MKTKHNCEKCAEESKECAEWSKKYAEACQCRKEKEDANSIM